MRSAVGDSLVASLCSKLPRGRFRSPPSSKASIEVCCISSSLTHFPGQAVFLPTPPSGRAQDCMHALKNDDVVLFLRVDRLNFQTDRLFYKILQKVQRRRLLVQKSINHRLAGEHFK